MEETTHKKTTGQKFTEAQDRFFESNWSFFVFTTAIAVFGALQLALFLLTDFKVSGSSDVNHWQSWLYMIISPLGAALSLIGYVFTIRVDKRFFWPNLIGQVIMGISSFLGGMTWTALMMLPAILIGVYRYVIINRRGNDYKMDFKKIERVTLWIVLFITAFAYALAIIPTTGDYIWFNDEIGLLGRLIDITTANLVLIATVFILTKNRNAFLIFISCNILFIGMFIVTSLWMSALQLVIYFVCNVCAAAAWTYKTKHSEDFK